MVKILGYNDKGYIVWSAVVQLENYERNPYWFKQDALNHGSVRVTIDMAL